MIPLSCSEALINVTIVWQRGNVPEAWRRSTFRESGRSGLLQNRHLELDLISVMMIGNSAFPT
jgi:hypothetical protein